MDWFLYDNGLRHERVNYLMNLASNVARCCLIHASIIIPRDLLYLLYLYPCLDVGLLCLIHAICFSFSSLLSVVYFIENVLLLLGDNMDEECE